ncbi:hypothetical protein BH18ACT11_BH18ACT11_00220 [soil metagenome]
MILLLQQPDLWPPLVRFFFALSVIMVGTGGVVAFLYWVGKGEEEE